MTAKERLVRVLSTVIYPKIGVRYEEVVADYLLDNDVVPVVRCKDCYRRRDDGLCTFLWAVLPENFYCGSGIRKDEVIE